MTLGVCSTVALSHLKLFHAELTTVFLIFLMTHSVAALFVVALVEAVFGALRNRQSNSSAGAVAAAAGAASIGGTSGFTGIDWILLRLAVPVVLVVLGAPVVLLLLLVPVIS